VVLRHFHRTRSRAARCDSFAGKVFSLLVVSSRWTRWTRWFTWFGLPERNTLRPRENWVVLCSSLPSLSLFFFSTAPEKRCLPEPFIAQGRAVTMSPEARQVAPRWLKPYTVARVLLARSSKWCLVRQQQRGVVLSPHPAILNMVSVVVPSCRVYHHCSYVQEWSAGPGLHCWTEL
jgi:hypothetical protein